MYAGRYNIISETRDVLSEVLISMRKNKRRIALTGFSIGWGIFLLIVLLGAGNGFINGTRASMGSYMDNVVTFSAGVSIQPYSGYPKGRKLSFDDVDIKLLKKRFPDNVEKILPAVQTSQKVSCESRIISTTVSGFYPDYMRRELIHLVDGRDICDLDVERFSKVCVISRRTQQVLFKDNPRPLGSWISVGGTMLMVVGIYEFDDSMMSGQTVYAPFTTVRQIYCPEGHYDRLRVQIRDIKTLETNDALINEMTAELSARHHCSSTDRGAIAYNSYFESVGQTLTALGAINSFIWIIGIATLLGGVVGVSNIMLITVRERTKELGIRKAMGAHNSNIISLVLIESVIITLLFGYIGMMMGVGLTQLMDKILKMSNITTGFVNPTVDMAILIEATAVMLVAGLVAGYFPARRAVSLKLVNALSS